MNEEKKKVKRRILPWWCMPIWCRN